MFHHHFMLLSETKKKSIRNRSNVRISESYFQFLGSPFLFFGWKCDTENKHWFHTKEPTIGSFFLNIIFFSCENRLIVANIVAMRFVAAIFFLIHLKRTKRFFKYWLDKIKQWRKDILIIEKILGRKKWNFQNMIWNIVNELQRKIF